MASIKERMVQALNSGGIDLGGVEIAKNSQGYWEASVGNIILRVRQGETWACVGDGLARGSASSKKTGLGDIEDVLETATRRLDITRKIGTDILRWTRMDIVFQKPSEGGPDILVSTPSGAVFGINFSGRSLGRQESAFVSEVSTEGSSDRETDLARDLLYEVINSVL